MALKTPEEYKESLRKMKPNIYKFGELIEDVTTHPATKLTIEGHSQIFAAQHNPEYRDIVTTKSHLTGEVISRYLSIIRTPEDQIMNSKMKRLIFHLTGTCTGGRCAGWNSINAMWATTYEMDKKLGTNYHKRLKNWLLQAQKNDITVAGALTDPKGDRTKSPSEQEDPDMHLRIVKKNSDGIVVRGAKIMICGVAASNEIFVLPGSAYKEKDADYAVSFVIPRDIKGLTIVETRHPSDLREFEEDWSFDNPVKIGGITQAYLFFEDVFIPWERVFMCGEYQYTGTAVTYFILPYRSAIGACVAGQGDLMIASSVLIARANGLSQKTFRDKLIEMIIRNEITFGMGIAAAALGKQHPSGYWICDPVLSNANKVLVGRLPYINKVMAQDIGGGIAETGCMPSSKDFYNEKYGYLVQKYLKAKVDAETRAKLARFIEWLTVGAGIPGCLHGGGSPDGAKLFINRFYEWDKYINYVKRLINIEDIPEQKKKK